MNTDDVLKGLRYQGDKHKNDVVGVGETNISAMALDAADLIESLQSQLAASQRREQAAVEDLESLMRESKELCACTYCGIDQSWGCSLHKTSSMCMPKWRGPQDGKGEAE